MRRLCLFPLMLALGASALPAQQVDWVTQLLTAAQLPIVTLDARREGVRHDEIIGILDAVRRANIPAYEAAALIDTARVVRREHGPVDNFGAFVQAQLAQGKRGRDLAAAIRAEHARMGRGPGTGAKGGAQSRGNDDDRGNPANRPGAPGRGNAAQPSRGQGNQGRADTARGRSETQRGRPSNPGSQGKSGENTNQGKRPDERGQARPDSDNR